MKKYLLKVTKLDGGRGETSAGGETGSSSLGAEVANPESCCSVKSPKKAGGRRRGDPAADTPTSTCPTIASALWKPLWPPGWHPRSAAPKPPSPVSDGSNPSLPRLKRLPLITMSCPDGSDSGKDVITSESSAKVSEGSRSPSDEIEYIESWLDEHPAFLQNYFVRKASRSVVDAWLQARTSQSAGAPSAGSVSAPASGATTPVRKISAHEFEQGSLFLRPMVSTTSDGTPTFLPVVTSDPSPDITSVRRRKTRQELEALDEKQLIFELVKDICNDLDVKSLCHKILQNVSILTNADRCSLFLVKGEKNDPKRYFVSTLFDVSSDSTIEQMEKREEIRVDWGTGIVGYAASSGSPVHISDCYSDDRFSDLVDRRTGYRTRNMLCAPIHDISGEVMGVAQVINKKPRSKDDDPEPDFTNNDMEVFTSYLQFCGIGLRNAQLFERSQLENKRNQVLLDLARMVFEEQSTLEHIVYRIMVHIQSLLCVERCQILLIAEDSEYSDEGGKTFSRIFDLEAGDLSVEEDDNRGGRESPFEGRFPINVGITGFVATTGHTVNIPDAYLDPKFDQHVDDNSISGFKHKSILCMPIKNSSSKIIGVSQLVNKLNGCPFSKNDENLFEVRIFCINESSVSSSQAFLIFCGMGIHNVRMYEEVVKAMAKQRVTFEILSYHATAPFEEAQRLAKSIIPSTQALRLADFSFSDFSLDENTLVKGTLRMFLDLDLIERFHMDYGTLCRWLLSVKKNYRQVTYHNWRHAFNVAQTMFSIIVSTGLASVLGEIETLALLVACLCHDLDHRGTNNSFQIKSCSPLAQLYSTSVMERHHFDQCLMILNTQGNQILGSLSADEYRKVIHVLEEAILATDLAVYFNNRSLFMQLVSLGDTNLIFGRGDDGSLSNDTSSRSLLRGMLMTACDIAAITKPWEVQRVVAQLVASEFFQQGDIEKSQLNIQPLDMMDREKKDELPKMQVSFIDSICLPIYDSFAKLFPQLKPLLDGVLSNRQNWIKLGKEQEKLREWAEQESLRLVSQSESEKMESEKSESEKMESEKMESEKSESEKIKSESDEYRKKSTSSSGSDHSVNIHQRSNSVESRGLGGHQDESL